MRVRSGRLLAVLVLGFLLTSAAGALAQESSPSGSAADKKVTFTVGMTGDLNSANPFKQIDTTEAWVTSLMYDGLLRYKQEAYEPEPELVDSYESSEDGLTWTFHLRDGINWSDGQPITADDFVWTANFIVDNDISSWSDGYPYTDSIKAADDQTIVWKTTKPTGVPALPGYNILLPEHVWGDMSVKEVKDFRNFPNSVGSGPFVLTEWEQGEFWTMTAREDYWQGAPNIDEIVFRVYKNNESVVQALLKGAIDYTTVPTAGLFDSIKDREGIGSAIDSAEAFWQLSFNIVDDPKSTAHPAVLDKVVRQAVEHAIDRQTLIDRVLRGYGTPGNTPIPPVYDYWHWQPPEGVARGFNLEEANSMLEDAGYVDTDNDGIREMPGGGEPLDWRLFIASTDADGIKAGEFIKGWLRDIGIGVTLKTMTDTKLYDLWYGFDWDMILYSWGTGPDPDFLLSSFTSGQCGYWSDTCYSDEGYDAMYKEQQVTIDRAERQQIVHTMQEQLYDDSPEIVLWYPNSFEAWRSDRWTGFVRFPEPDGVAFLLNTYSARWVEPAAGATAASQATDSGIPVAVWLILGGVAAVGLGAVIVLRGRKRDEHYAG